MFAIKIQLPVNVAFVTNEKAHGRAVKCDIVVQEVQESPEQPEIIFNFF